MAARPPVIPAVPGLLGTGRLSYVEIRSVWFGGGLLSVPSVRHHARRQDAPSPGRNKATPCGAQPWVDVKRVLKPCRGHQVTGGSESGVWRGPDAGDFPRALPPPPVFGER